MGRARVGPCQSVADKQRAQQDDEDRAQGSGTGYDRGPFDQRSNGHGLNFPLCF
jgi:hypothetical protein